MFDSKKFTSVEKINDRNKNSLRPLVLILGFFAIASAGVILFALFQKLGPEASAAPGIYKTLNYQGKLEDVDGVTVADGSYNIKFTIYDAAAAGNVLWTARESDACGAAFNPSAKSVTTSLGVFSTQLGESGDCPINLDFNTDSYYLGVTVGADSEMMPRKRLGASGYAFNADLLDGLNTSAAGGASAFVPATDASGNLVLTGNVTFDTDTFFLDSTNNNIGIGTAAPGIGKTLDLTTTKKYGVYASTSFGTNDAAAVYGEATSTNNARKAGGQFVGAGPSGKGVLGSATATGNPGVTNYGGYFTAAGDTSEGVYGEATAAGAVANIGGYFTAAGNTGYGVWAVASGTAGINYGGYFISNGLGGYAVNGWATDTNAATNYGGHFQASGQTGIAVYGLASSTAGSNYGGNFQANGPGGYGVKGAASDISATPNYGGYFTAAGTGASTIGVYGQASGAGTVYAVRGAATSVAAVSNFGGFFTTAGTGAGASGIYSEAYGAAAVYAVQGVASGTGAVTNYGGSFQANGDTARAVYGSAIATGAFPNYGGYFTAAGTGALASGVYGEASGAGTVYGVRGYASNIGAVTNYGGAFQAAGETGRGVYGAADSATATINYGGFFIANGTGAGTAGVYGSVSGNASVYGVQGAATGTGAGVTNYGGYFTAASGQARAVYAEASNAAGTGYGVYSVALATSGTAVFGQATAVAGADNLGGKFEANGDTGAVGVWGAALGGTGTNYGVYGTVSSAAGWAGYFLNGNGLYASRFSIADTTSAIAYNTIGAPAASHTAAGEIENSSDLFIADDLETAGQAWFTGGHADLAEMVAYSGEGEAGDVVVVDENNDNSAKIATKPYDQSVLGIISTKPSLIITGDIKEGKLMAVAGRVPTKVTNVNGAIHRGDLLTTSSVPGRAMKATEPGPIVGKAMGECDEDECTIWVFLNVSWYGGVRTEAAAVSPITDENKNLERENLLTKLSELWQKIVSLIKK